MMTPERVDAIGSSIVAAWLWLGTPVTVVFAVLDPSWLRTSMILAVLTIGLVSAVAVDGIVDAMLRDQGRNWAESYFDDDEQEEPWAR